MSRIRQAVGVGFLVLGVLALPQAAELAETTGLLSVFGAVTECEDGRRPVGSLGISGLECNCTLATRRQGVSPLWRFRSEPRIVKLDPEGPSRDKLKPGDRIVAIDGHLITTAHGGKLYSDPPVAAPMPLTIRRQGRELEVSVVPEPMCPEPLAPAAPPVPPAMAAAPPELEARPARPAPVPPARRPDHAVPAAPAPVPPARRPDHAAPAHLAPPAPPDMLLVPLVPGGSLMPRGWTGMGLTCDSCTIRRGHDHWVSLWRFESPPQVYSVDPGSPAAEAGLERGDLLTHIDGLRLDSDEGGARFSNIEPGQRVSWTLQRQGRSLTRSMTAGESPQPAVPAVDAPEARASASHLRYAGTVGGTAVEVRGPGHVVVSAQGGELVIVTGDAVVRLWKDEDEEGGS